jgi:hypothetical protein
LENGGAGDVSSSGGTTSAGTGTPGTGAAGTGLAGTTPAGGTSAGSTAAGGAFGRMRVPPGMGGANAGGQSSSAASCPTYQDDFLPQINAPVCSKCHQGTPRLPDWGSYSTASASCFSIGSKVANGSMPPRGSGYSLTTAQRSLVASWVMLGCPQSKSNLPSSCN